MPERHVGVVAKWLNHKGIGFITPEGKEANNGDDVLVHYQQIKQESTDGFKSLEQGSKVEYELETDPLHPEKQVAVKVTGLGGEDCTAKTKGKGKNKPAQSGESEGAEPGTGVGGEDCTAKPKGKGKGKSGRKGKGKGKGKKGKKDEEAEEGAGEAEAEAA